MSAAGDLFKNVGKSLDGMGLKYYRNNYMLIVLILIIVVGVFMIIRS